MPDRRLTVPKGENVCVFKNKLVFYKNKFRHRYLDNWHRRFTFTIVRNPWDKVVSHYLYRLQTDQTGLSHSDMSISNWVERAYRYKDPAYRDNEKMVMPQTKWVQSAEVCLLMDYFGFFEDLKGSFKEVMKRTGLSVSLPYLKRTKRRDCRNYYDNRPREIVAESIAQGIETLGYKFL